MSLEEGLDCFLAASQKRWGLIETTSRTNPGGVRKSVQELNCPVSPLLILHYSPPDEVSFYRKYCEITRTKYAPRVEYLEPELNDTTLNYLIVDEFIHTGTTLLFTGKALIGRGVPSPQIWTFAKILGETRLYLDRYDMMLDYLRNLD